MSSKGVVQYRSRGVIRIYLHVAPAMAALILTDSRIASRRLYFFSLRFFEFLCILVVVVFSF